MSIIFSFVVGIFTGVISNVLYAKLTKVNYDLILKSENWNYEENNIYYKKQENIKIQILDDNTKFPFYRKTKEGMVLIPYAELQRDTFLKKEIWDFCNKGLPIDINSYQCVTAKLLNGNTEIFSCELLRVTLKHCIATGSLYYFFIPQNLSRIKSEQNTLFDSKEYKICQLLYLHENDGIESNDKYLDCIDWSYVNGI